MYFDYDSQLQREEKMKDLNEIEIKKCYDNGESVYSLSKRLEVNKSVINRIINNGRYYIDINTGNIIFTAKKISLEEQQFNYLCYYATTNNKNINTSINQRLAEYLNINDSQTHRWSKKDYRLIGCNRQGIIDSYFKQCISDFYDFLDKYQPKRITCEINAPNTQGLYFLYQDNELKYIGRTKDIKRRLYQHAYFSHIDGLIGTYDVKVIEVENEVDLEIMEIIFIKLLKPPLNIEFYDSRVNGKVFIHMLGLIPNEYICNITTK